FELLAHREVELEVLELFELLKGLGISFPLKDPGFTAHQPLDRADVVSLSNRRGNFLLRTTAAHSHSHRLIGRNLRHEAIELSYARDVFAVETNNHVVFLQACLFSRATLNHLSDTNTARRAHVIARHVFAIDVLSVNTEIAAVSE